MGKMNVDLSMVSMAVKCTCELHLCRTRNPIKLLAQQDVRIEAPFSCGHKKEIIFYSCIKLF